MAKQNRTETDADALTVFEGVRKAQAVLTDHIRPGGLSAEDAVNEVIGILDDHLFVRALNKVPSPTG